MSDFPALSGVSTAEAIQLNGMDQPQITHHEHCWHGTGMVLTSFPAQYPEVCCQCGEKRVRRETVPARSQHGPFDTGF